MMRTLELCWPAVEHHSRNDSTDVYLVTDRVHTLLLGQRCPTDSWTLTYRRCFQRTELIEEMKQSRCSREKAPISNEATMPITLPCGQPLTQSRVKSQPSCTWINQVRKGQQWHSTCRSLEEHIGPFGRGQRVAMLRSSLAMPSVGPAGAPLFPLVHLLPHLSPFLLFSFFYWLFFFCPSLPFLPE